MTNYKKILGNKGEKLALKYLEEKGYNFLVSNFVYPKFGEIDIIVQKKDVIVFVEVKYRTNSLTTINQTISMPKQRRIIKTALYFMMQKRYSISDFIMRFDVAFIDQENLTYIENAFTQEN